MIREQNVQALLMGCIYKYGPIDYLERTLGDLTLGFSSLASFNDLYETEVRLTHYFHSLEDEQVLLDPINNTLHRIQALAAEYLASVRVTCFSRSSINSLMWAHYANNHNGVSYCFDFTNNSPPFRTEVDWGNVIYSSLVPELKVFQDQTTEGMLPALLSDVVLTKSPDWSYEQEVRFFRVDSKSHIDYDPARLRAIIIGRRIDKSRVHWISELVNV